MKRQGLLIPLCYLTLYVVWGSTYFFIKMSVQTIPPFYVVGLRYVIGGALFFAILFARRRVKVRPTLHQIGASLLLGALLLLGGNGLITIAEQKVDSYIAALLIAATPMVVAFFDRVLLDKRIALVRLAGIAIGIGGVTLLLYDGDSLSGGLSPEVGMVLAGVGCWGLATSLGHRLRAYPDPLVNSGIQMLAIGVVCLAGASFVYPPLPQILPAVSLRSVLALLYLAVVGSSAFAAYTYLISREPAVRVSSYALVNPVIATLLGLLVGDETPVPLLAAGLPLVLLGVTLMLYGEAIVAYLRKPPAAKPARVSEFPPAAE